MHPRSDTYRACMICSKCNKLICKQPIYITLNSMQNRVSPFLLFLQRKSSWWRHRKAIKNHPQIPEMQTVWTFLPIPAQISCRLSIIMDRTHAKFTHIHTEKCTHFAMVLKTKELYTQRNMLKANYPALPLLWTSLKNTSST